MAEAIERLPNSVGGLRELTKSLYGKVTTMKAHAQRLREQNKGRIEGVVETVETVGFAWAVSWFNAKNGAAVGVPYQVMGYDADLVVGAALFGAGLFELGGKYDEHFYALGAGALSAWATRQAWSTGTKARTAATTTTGVAPAGHYVAGVAPAGTYQP